MWEVLAGVSSRFAATLRGPFGTVSMSLCLRYFAESWGENRESDVCTKKSEEEEKRELVPALSLGVGCVALLVVVLFVIRRCEWLIVADSRR